MGVNKERLHQNKKMFWSLSCYQECFGFGCIASFHIIEQPRPLKYTDYIHLKHNFKIGKISVTKPVTSGKMNSKL